MTGFDSLLTRYRMRNTLKSILGVYSLLFSNKVISIVSRIVIVLLSADLVLIQPK